MRTLTEEQKELAFEMAISGSTLQDISTKLGFTSHWTFYQWRKKNPLFDKALLEARSAHCEHLEDKILNIQSDVYDPQEQRVRVESMTRVMAFRNPAKYNPKVDLNITGQLDLAGALAAADQRVIDITPAQNQLPQPDANDFSGLIE